MLKLTITLFLIFSFSGCLSSDTPETQLPNQPPNNSLNETVNKTPADPIIVDGNPPQLKVNKTHIPGTFVLNGAAFPINQPRSPINFLENQSYSWEYQFQNQTWSGKLENGPKTPWSDDPRIFPGAWVGRCTLAWILRDATNETLYAMTAGHCGEIGHKFTATHEHSGNNINGIQTQHPVGEMAYKSENGTRDFGFIKIYSESRNLVHPGMQHWTGPVGVTPINLPESGDAICYYGNTGISPTNYTNTRCGKYQHFRQAIEGPNLTQSGSGVAWGGDSGAPIIHHETGTALGIMTTVSINSPGTFGFVGVCHALDWLREAHGLELQLATSTYTGLEVQNNVDQLPYIGGEGIPPSCTYVPGPKILE